MKKIIAISGVDQFRNEEKDLCFDLTKAWCV